MDVHGAAEVLGVSDQTVRRLLDDRQIAFHRIGVQLRIAASDLDSYLMRTRVATKAKDPPPR